MKSRKSSLSSATSICSEHTNPITWVWIFGFTHSRSWALLAGPPIVQSLKNLPAFYGTRRFSTVFTGALHRSLSWAISIQSIPSQSITLRSILILSTNLRLDLHSGLFWFSHQYPICIPLVPHSWYMPRPSHPSWLGHSNYTWRWVEVEHIYTRIYVRKFFWPRYDIIIYWNIVYTDNIH
jgi:hypothetical protein